MKSLKTLYFVKWPLKVQNKIKANFDRLEHFQKRLLDKAELFKWYYNLKFKKLRKIYLYASYFLENSNDFQYGLLS